MTYKTMEDVIHHTKKYGIKGFLRVLLRPLYRWLGYNAGTDLINVDKATMIKERTVMQRTIYGIYSFLNHRRKLSIFDVWAPIMTRDEITEELSFLIQETDYRVSKEAEKNYEKARTKSYYILIGLEVLLEKNISNAMFIHGFEMLLRDLWETPESRLPPGLQELLQKASKDGARIQIRGGSIEDLKDLFDKFMRDQEKDSPEEED